MIDENVDPFEALLKKEEEAEVNAMSDSLTENQRDIVEAIHFSWKNMSEYAEKVGITKQAAREDSLCDEKAQEGFIAYLFMVVVKRRVAAGCPYIKNRAVSTTNKWHLKAELCQKLE